MLSTVYMQIHDYWVEGNIFTHALSLFIHLFFVLLPHIRTEVNQNKTAL